jgi:hypothetical protein
VRQKSGSLAAELKLAKQIWGGLTGMKLTELRQVLHRYKLSVTLGEVTNLDNHWYVTHSGLIRLATRRRCDGIRTTIQQRLSDPAIGRWVFKATVYKTPGSKGFVGYGDADPSNVSTFVHGAEMRIAETRAVNRALRKAYGIGLCSVEELGALANSRGPASDHAPSTNNSGNGPSNGHPRLRDQLCLLIRQHNLDPTLVKAYAADFCGTPSLKEANRDLVQSFISHLTVCVKEDRDMLICRLNSYAQPQEVKP